ncbi:baseplate assembly protein [Erwinia phage vB_EamM_Asesino]|uniref:Structural protein n=1 Tax=Erwinia phage vB_EamM_Asesino TaxID=1883370 RepID=A0A1B2IAD4_9CAUD|nr:baseplate assembly protein [Erwinia phage vB_EamM_Asesino]ANZ48206.1 putative structural protein [Erwinia phage vB_EamM_Asesino]
MEKSGVDFFSIGIVAEDKARGAERCKIIPIETNFVNPTQVQSIESANEKQHASDNAMDNLQVTTGNAITAKWWKFNSNRVNPPDVQKEDYVIILRLGKTDIYFWIDLNMANVKRLEDAVYAWAADPENQMADDLSNAYVLNISSIDKHITLRTTMLNGEKAAFLFQFDNANGTWQCVDQKGNKYYLNSVEDDLGFENAMLSKVNINKEDMFLYAKKSINLETETLNEKVSKRITNASASIKFTTKDWLTTSPTSKFDGNFEVSQDFKYGGKGVGVGTFTVSEAIIANITFTKHVHTEQGDGKDVSTPH